MKKLLIIGAIALVVFGCVLAAGCTSTTTNTSTTTTEDFAVGTWSTDDGTAAVILTNDFKGIYIDGDKETNITWKKSADGTYTFIREDGTQENVTINRNKGTLTNTAGAVLTKVLSGTSGAINPETEKQREKEREEQFMIETMPEIEKKEIRNVLSKIRSSLSDLNDQSFSEEDLLENLKDRTFLLPEKQQILVQQLIEISKQRKQIMEPLIEQQKQIIEELIKTFESK